jgi:misacylated tRNA(Ala) deacylase
MPYEPVSLQPATIPGLTKKEKIAGHEVTLEDTVLFPEGGGQPDDRGTISGVAVTRVRRAGTEAVHFIPGECHD